MWSKTLVVACMTGVLGVAQAPPAAPKIAVPGSASFLGVGIQEIDAERAKQLKLSEEAGVEITRIAPDSPAEKAGLQTGDIVTQYNGQRVEGIDQFSRMVRETPAGREIRLGIIRNGSPQTLTAKIASRPAVLGQLVPAVPGREPLELRIPDIPRSLLTWRSTTLGMEAEPVSGQLAEFFGVKEGVLVRSVTQGSAAEKAGIKAGDVITRVDDARVTTPADISNRIRGLRNRSVSVVLTRDHKEITVTVMLAARNQGTVGRVRPATRVLGRARL